VKHPPASRAATAGRQADLGADSLGSETQRAQITR
jgi:hypothetical protein